MAAEDVTESEPTVALAAARLAAAMGAPGKPELAAVLAAPGAALVVLALTIKALALPALGLLLLTPIISRGFSRLTSSAALLAGASPSRGT